ncbi:CsbD family protein, partial [Streptomyces sp. SID1034]
KVEQAKGKVKEKAGSAVGNERLEAEGHAEQAKGDAREAKENLGHARRGPLFLAQQLASA